MPKLTTKLAIVGAALTSFGIFSCAPAPVYYETPEVHNVTVVEKPKPKPKPAPKPTPKRDAPEDFRAVY